MFVHIPSPELIVTPPPSPQPFTTIRVWSPSTIRLTTFAFGFPVGMILAAINWQRLGLHRKAAAHLVGGGWMLFGLSTSGFWLPDPLFGWLIAIGLFVTMPLYLGREMTHDITACHASMQPVLAAEGWRGFLAGFGVLIGYIVTLSLIPLWIFGITLVIATVAALFLTLGEPPTPLPETLD